ncbi:unnamed protein product [Meganyctiphanes norvegica]|uniref:Uncharacterized protein n=1 Tax=Meganyctiphanes norvegica TaxID=48144 RepID=A0AAV2SWD8_MEGNR
MKKKNLLKKKYIYMLTLTLLNNFLKNILMVPSMLPPGPFHPSPLYYNNRMETLGIICLTVSADYHHPGQSGTKIIFFGLCGHINKFFEYFFFFKIKEYSDKEKKKKKKKI